MISRQALRFIALGSGMVAALCITYTFLVYTGTIPPFLPR